MAARDTSLSVCAASGFTSMAVARKKINLKRPPSPPAVRTRGRALDCRSAATDRKLPGSAL